MSCSICGTDLNEKSITLTIGDETRYYCCDNCMNQAPALSGIRHRSISSIVLNKTFLEVFALITGFGGVYYTIFENASRALLLDAFSVASALAAIFIGVEHLRYVEEHDLLKRAIIFISIITITGFLMLVWTYGLSAT